MNDSTPSGSPFSKHVCATAHKHCFQAICGQRHSLDERAFALDHFLNAKLGMRSEDDLLFVAIPTHSQSLEWDLPIVSAKSRLDGCLISGLTTETIQARTRPVKAAQPLRWVLLFQVQNSQFLISYLNTNLRDIEASGLWW